MADEKLICGCGGEIREIRLIADQTFFWLFVCDECVYKMRLDKSDYLTKFEAIAAFKKATRTPQTKDLNE